MERDGGREGRIWGGGGEGNSTSAPPHNLYAKLK